MEKIDHSIKETKILSINFVYITALKFGVGKTFKTFNLHLQ